jgi:hypothetical protein
MIYKVVLSDRSFNIIKELQNEITSLSWGYSRLGGCADFSFTVPKPIFKDFLIGMNFNVKIYKRNQSDSNYELIYQGRIESKNSKVTGKTEEISISGSGYQSSLRDIYIDRDYVSTEASLIVKDILDQDIVPNTPITYNVSDIVATTFTPSELEFNTNAQSAFRTISDLVGLREWGVDRNRKFFFKQRSEARNYIYYLSGGDIYDLAVDITTDDILNRIVVIGGDVDGEIFSAVYNEPSSQLKWGRRDLAIKNSAIVTTDVAQQFADSYFAEFSDVSFRAKGSLLADGIFEETVPLGLFCLVPDTVKYGEKPYGTFLYSGVLSFQINKINYKVDSSSNLSASLELGRLRPNIAETISQLEYEIEQINSSDV